MQFHAEDAEGTEEQANCSFDMHLFFVVSFLSFVSFVVEAVPLCTLCPLW